MAKDPAFLFYPGDWQGGTSTLSRFLKGCYMDILVAQFNSGPLSLEEIKTVLGSDFGTSWPTLQKKFKQAANGLFFNERLEAEKNKRKEYCASRRDNKLNKKPPNQTYDPTYDKHMCNHMENGNKNGNETEFETKGGAGGKSSYSQFKNGSLNTGAIKEAWLQFHKAKGWPNPTGTRWDESNIESIAKQVNQACADHGQLPTDKVVYDIIMGILEEISKDKFHSKNLTIAKLEQQFSPTLRKIKSKYDTATKTPWD